MYAPVTPKGCLIMGATIPNDEKWLCHVPTPSGGESLCWFPADTKSKVPAPYRTKLEEINLSECTSWPPEDCKEVAELSESADVVLT